MVEYIKREDAYRTLSDYYHHSTNIQHMALREALDRVPDANVVERKTGKWMTTDAFPHHVYCSVCHKTYIPNDNWQIWQDHCNDGGLPRNYCPNCGAKMEG